MKKLKNGISAKRYPQMHKKEGDGISTGREKLELNEKK